MPLLPSRVPTSQHVQKILAALLILSAPSVTFAEEPKVIADTSLGRITLDERSITQAESYTQAWFTYEFKKTQRLAAPLNIVFGLRKDLVNIDCKKNLLGISQSDFFDDNKLVYTKRIETADVKFSAIAPESMAEKLHGAVCRNNTAQ